MFQTTNQLEDCQQDAISGCDMLRFCHCHVFFMTCLMYFAILGMDNFGFCQSCVSIFCRETIDNIFYHACGSCCYIHEP